MLLSTLPKDDIIIATISDKDHLSTGVLNARKKIDDITFANGNKQRIIIDTTRSTDLSISQIMTALSAVTDDAKPMRLTPQVKEVVFVGTDEKIDLVIHNIGGLSLGTIRTFETLEIAVSYFQNQ